MICRNRKQLEQSGKGETGRLGQCTQGDVSSMGLYGLGIKPLIEQLDNTVVDSEQCIHNHQSSQRNEDVICPMCKEEVKDGQDNLECDTCNVWSHKLCLHMPDEEFQLLDGTEIPWYCARCMVIKANKIRGYI